MQYNRSALYESQAAFNNTGQVGGQWYFYNLNAKSFGQPEFRMKWGERVLEDNWRRKNKRAITQQTQEEGSEADSLAAENGTPVLDNKTREYYLVDIPLTDSAMDISNERLEDALYNMGVIYMDDLLDYDESIESFRALMNRYPDT